MHISFGNSYSVSSINDMPFHHWRPVIKFTFCLLQAAMHHQQQAQPPEIGGQLQQVCFKVDCALHSQLNVRHRKKGSEKDFCGSHTFFIEDRSAKSTHAFYSL